MDVWSKKWRNTGPKRRCPGSEIPSTGGCSVPSFRSGMPRPRTPRGLRRGCGLGEGRCFLDGSHAGHHATHASQKSPLSLSPSHHHHHHHQCHPHAHARTPQRSQSLSLNCHQCPEEHLYVQVVILRLSHFPPFLGSMQCSVFCIAPRSSAVGAEVERRMRARMDEDGYFVAADLGGSRVGPSRTHTPASPPARPHVLRGGAIATARLSAGVHHGPKVLPHQPLAPASMDSGELPGGKTQSLRLGYFPRRRRRPGNQHT